MSPLSCLLVVTVWSVCVEARLVSLNDNGDTLALLRQIISNSNELAKKNGLDQFELNEFDFNAVAFELSLIDGTLGNLASLDLFGDNHVFNRTESNDEITFNYDIVLSFKDLHIQSRFHYFTPIFSGTTNIQTGLIEEAFRIAGAINIKKNGNCEAALDRVEVTRTGSFTVDIKDNKLGYWGKLGGIVIQFGLNYILPWFKNSLNTAITEGLNQGAAKSHFNQVVCMAFQN